MPFHPFNALGALLLAASAAASAQDKPPIRLGGITSLTGPTSYAGSTAAAKAVFDRVNARGGVKGRRIEYLVSDDRFDIATSSQLGRRLVDEDGVVAMVGGASFADCAANGPMYRTKKVVSVPGIGVGPFCYGNPQIVPVNAGAFAAIPLSLYFASQQLKKDKVCALLMNAPAFDKFYGPLIERFEKASGTKLAFEDRSVGPQDDLTPFVLRASQAGCQAVFFNGAEPQVIALMRAVAQQKLGGLTWIVQSSSYSESVAKALGGAGEGLIANAEFEPWSDGNPAVLADWKQLMAEAGVAPNALSQGGYTAATLMVELLESLPGEISRESVATALAAAKPVATPLTGGTYRFVASEAKDSRRGGKFVRLVGGRWVTVTPEWIRLPS